jgi:hypothetical protein
MQIGHQKSQVFKSVKLVYTSHSREFSWNKGIRYVPLLPHRRSWGSGRWMCTCTANSRHNPPAIQRYIPNNVQRHDSNSSEDRVMGGSLAWVLLPAYSELLLDVGDEDGGTACSARNEIDGKDALVAKWPRLAGRRTRIVILSSSDGDGAFVSAVPGKRFHFITAAGL